MQPSAERRPQTRATLTLVTLLTSPNPRSGALPFSPWFGERVGPVDSSPQSIDFQAESPGPILSPQGEKDGAPDYTWATFVKPKVWGARALAFCRLAAAKVSLQSFAHRNGNDRQARNSSGFAFAASDISLRRACRLVHRHSRLRGAIGDSLAAACTHRRCQIRTRRRRHSFHCGR